MINYQDFTYNGSKITFSFSEKCVMLSATKMAKPFGKFPSDWLRQKSTKEYVEAVASETQIPISQLVITKKGNDGTEQGTWMHKDVALEFARWLAPLFGLWCNRRIEELLTTGHTEIALTTNACPDIICRQERRHHDNCHARTRQRLFVLGGRTANQMGRQADATPFVRGVSSRAWIPDVCRGLHRLSHGKGYCAWIIVRYRPKEARRAKETDKAEGTRDYGRSQLFHQCAFAWAS